MKRGIYNRDNRSFRNEKEIHSSGIKKTLFSVIHDSHKPFHSADSADKHTISHNICLLCYNCEGCDVYRGGEFLKDIDEIPYQLERCNFI